MSIVRPVSETKLEPLIQDWKIPNPTHLWLAGKPSTPGEVVEPKLTPLSEVEAILGIKWTEVVMGTQETNKQLLPHAETAATDKFQKVSYEEYVARLKELHENCVIRWINETIGWVLTVRKGGKLSKGFIGCYTGEARVVNESEKADTFLEYSAYIFSDESGLGIVDAKNCGNLLRLAPCLLSKSEMTDNFLLHPSIKNKLASENLYLNGAIIMAN